MKYKLLAEIIQSLLLARWRQSLVAAISVTFSIAMFILLLGFMNGLNDLLENMVLNRTPHIRLFNEIKPNPNQPLRISDEFKDGHNFIRSIKPSGGRLEISNSLAIIQALESDPRVAGIAPKISVPVLYNAGIIDITGMVNGIDVVSESNLFFFKDYIIEGEAIDLKNIPNSIILGKGIADKLLANVGDVIQLTTSKGDRMALKVVGFFQFGILDFDKVQSFTSLATAQKLLGKPNDYITDIQIKLKDFTRAPSVAKEFAGLFYTVAEDMQTANAQFETGNKIRTIMSYSVGIVLLIVAGFGIYNILNMMIYEKMDTIAILKATGFAGRDVRRIFIGISIAIGLVGSALGLFFGFSFSMLLHMVPFNLPGLASVKTIPINYNIKYYLIGVIFALVTTYFAGFFPAKKASKIDPVVIIRGK
ncbi:MAG: FtsX-like permease family protein [Saprospiraceae bacterium]